MPPDTKDRTPAEGWGFRTPLRYELLPPPALRHPFLQFFMAPRRKRKLLRDLHYVTKSGEDRITYRGFLSDLGSIPRIAWVIFPPFGQNEECFWQHDSDCEDLNVSRRAADYYLRESIEAQQMLSLPRPADQTNSLKRIWLSLVLITVTVLFLFQRWAIWCAVRTYAVLSRKT